MATQNDIYKEYRSLHATCPECGGDSLEKTCVGYIFVNLATAMDMNRVSCECGWIGVCHDLFPMTQTEVAK